jgi:hypothetical protein
LHWFAPAHLFFFVFEMGTNCQRILWKFGHDLAQFYAVHSKSMVILNSALSSFLLCSCYFRYLVRFFEKLYTARFKHQIKRQGLGSDSKPGCLVSRKSKIRRPWKNSRFAG